jgi:hypothetical protein
MSFTKILSILILSIVFPVMISACGSCDKINKQKKTTTIETESPEYDNFAAAESGDLLLFMEALTGYKHIVQINGIIDIDNLRALLKIADSNETDSIGRRYFTYSVPTLRQAPVSMPQGRFDIESCMDNAASELKQTYVGDILLIARRIEKVITYVVNGEDDNYRYGVFYIVSAIPVEIQSPTVSK